MQFKRSGSSEADNNALLRSALGNLRNEVFTVRSDGTHDRAPRSFLMPLLVRHFADRRHAPLLLPQRTEQYCAAHSSAPRPAGALAAIDAAVVALRDPKAERMSTGAWQGELLAALIRACGARRALEIGTFYGYSAACIAHALRAVGGRLTTVDSSAKSIAAAKRAFEAAALDNIDVVHARGVDFLTRLVDAKTPATAERQFDFIYIDADKGSYAAYVDLILDHALLSARGLLVVDNVLWKGEVVAAEHLSTAQVSKQARALVAFNAKVSRDPRIRCTLLPMRDGLYLIQWQDTAL